MTVGRIPSVEGGIQPTIVDAKGDIIAATAADTVARLAVGANDTVLVADSAEATGLKWATPASGGMTLISTTTFTGASITLSSIPATFNNLLVVIRNFLPATDTANMNIRINGDSANRYTNIQTFGLGTAASFGSSEVRVTPANDNAVSQNISVIELFDYTNTTTFKMWRTTSISNDPTTTTSIRSNATFAVYNQTPAISSITFLPDTGNFTSGTALLYGVK